MRVPDHAQSFYIGSRRQGRWWTARATAAPCPSLVRHEGLALSAFNRGWIGEPRKAQANASSFTTEVLSSLPLVAGWTGVREWIRERRPMPAVYDGGPGVTTPGRRVDWRTRMDTGGQCQLVYNGGPGATTPGRRVDCRTRMDTGGEAKANASSFTTEVLASLPLVAEWTGVREWIRQANASSFTTEVLASLPLVSEWTGVREWIREVRQRPMPARLRRRSWRHYPWSQSGLAYENGYRRPMPARLRRRSWRHYPLSESGLAYENGYGR
ncbi:uncharacterized protein LOC144114757 isoform X3 [Amblyomma americanum]